MQLQLVRKHVRSCICKHKCYTAFLAFLNLLSSYYTTVVLGMAARSPHFTALEVGTLVTEGDDDTEFLFPGSDDDFNVVDIEYDPLEREQGVCR